MPEPIDFAAEIIPKESGRIRVATFNVENLFSRPVAMNYEDNSVGQPYLDAYNELNAIFAKDIYTADDKLRLLELLDEHKLLATRPPPNKHLVLRVIRGKLFASHSGTFSIVATGRADWVGWMELVRAAVNDKAIFNTARVIAAVNPDLLAVCEVEDRLGLARFHETVLLPILKASGRSDYPYVLVVDGNDQRGIDVGLVSRFPITDLSTHIFDPYPGSNKPRVFSRDCCEYFVEVPGIPGRLVVMANHFTSRGSDHTGMTRRVFQCDRVVEILNQRMAQGFQHAIVCGDLNDTPTKPALQSLITHPALTDAVALFAIQIDPTGKRLGTYETGLEQFDYLLMTESVTAMAKNAGIERRGRRSSLWQPFDTVTASRFQASDHHCVWVDLQVT